MSGHVSDRLVDFLAGRLPPEERRKLEAHVEECGECGSAIAWVRRFREEALRQGVRHVPAMRVVEMGRTPEVATAAEREHLASCTECGGELRWVQGLPTSDNSEDPQDEAVPTLAPGREVPPLRGARRRQASALRIWLPMGLATAALLLIVVLPRWGGPDLSELAVVEPLPVMMHRAVPEPNSFEDHFQGGLEAYQDGDYALAREQLDRALTLQPDAPLANLYRGSALLLLDDPEGAVPSLRSTMEEARDPAVREEAAWQLANALLRAGRTEEAREILQVVGDGGGRRQSDAWTLGKKLEGAH